MFSAWSQSLKPWSWMKKTCVLINERNIKIHPLGIDGDGGAMKNAIPMNCEIFNLDSRQYFPSAALPLCA